uniref:Uncharacterized protein n=1 Tax=Anopheles farauti TaxID=69004 RepID=A0A182Q2A7_9DIPT
MPASIRNPCCGDWWRATTAVEGTIVDSFVPSGPDSGACFRAGATPCAVPLPRRKLTSDLQLVSSVLKLHEILYLSRFSPISVLSIDFKQSTNWRACCSCRVSSIAATPLVVLTVLLVDCSVPVAVPEEFTSSPFLAFHRVFDTAKGL